MRRTGIGNGAIGAMWPADRRTERPVAATSAAVDPGTSQEAA